MDVTSIKAARNLGELIQKSREYKNFAKVSLAVQKDEKIQSVFKKIRDSGGCFEKEEEKKEIFSKLNSDLMKKYKEADNELTELISGINAIIEASASGQDPQTASIELDYDDLCGSGCSGCSGCH